MLITILGFLNVNLVSAIRMVLLVSTVIPMENVPVKLDILEKSAVRVYVDIPEPKPENVQVI